LGAGLLRERAEAKVLGRSEGLDGDAAVFLWNSELCCSGFAGELLVELANGLETDAAEVLLGEKGFAEEDRVEGIAPKRSSPILRFAFAGGVSSLDFTSAGLG
jgi:hypothetical protein